MPRHARLLLPGVPLHIRQRAVDGRVCFRQERDFELYLGLTEELSRERRCDVHAYVLMSNHVHLLLTARETDGVSWFMKALAQRYSQHFNRATGRSGPLWDGRFRSSPVDSERYLLTCYRYIELNPVRAGMVAAAQEYPWSSHCANAWGAPSPFVTPHPVYLEMGSGLAARLEAYRALVAGGLGDSELATVRKALDANAALGDDDFVKEVGRLTGRAAEPLRRGRPRIAC